MNSIKKNIQDAYIKKYIAPNRRTDNRKLMEFRDSLLNLNSIHPADGSSAVKVGNTTVICGIKAELGIPKSESPDKGYLLINIELPSLCYKNISPCDHAMETTNFLNEMCSNFKILDLHQLCICVDKLVWVLSCDIYCLNYDGSIIDACILALLTALKTVKIPKINYNKKTEEVNVIENYNLLKFNCLPISSTFALFNDKYIIADPNEEEEQYCVSKLIVVTDGNLLLSIHKPEGKFIKDIQIQNCITYAKIRANKINQFINVEQ